MKTEVIVVENERDLDTARKLVASLGRSKRAKDVARLRAQALLLEAYEVTRWPPAPVSTADLIRYVMDEHGLTPADLVPILGTRSRVSEVLHGKRGLTLAMIWRLHKRLRVPADALISASAKAP
ncbi:MAG: XRE family transcriptional regulator [Alphaproteobacteria bacterium]|nr:XRE family transcriptional regulator [Alphaproteobacteria bacterium]